MPEKTKKHTTVKITRRMLKKMHACPNGIADVAKFLPATLHTDVEKNIPLALKLADAPFAHRGTDRVWWFMYTLRAESASGALPDDRAGLLAAAAHHDLIVYDTQLDAFIVAQWLAWTADKLATKAGR